MQEEISTPVSCCIIIKKDHVVIAQKPSGVWEFPGGKLEPGETIFGCAIREVMEELGIVIKPIASLTSHILRTDHGRTYELIPIVSEYQSGEIMLNEHISARWIPVSELMNVNWSDADKVLLGHFFKYLEGKK